jgi:glycosyltransferase involved in cell wall biosynthesis
MSTEKISVIIPQYKTEWFIRLCLRSLRKYSKGDVQVIVVDNNSCDGSVEYLKTVSWIDLIENKSALVGIQGHRQALDLALSMVKGDWVCFIHSDTIMLKYGWDQYLLEKLKKSKAVGLAPKHSYSNKFDSSLNKFSRRLREIREHILHPERVKNRRLKSYLYFIKKDFLEKFNYKFSNEKGEVGDEFYHKYINGRHPFIFLNREETEPLLWHTNNATSLATGQIQEAKLRKKFKSRLVTLDNYEISEILMDDSLDK